MSISYDSGRYGRGMHPPYCTCFDCNERRGPVAQPIPPEPLPPEPPKQDNENKGPGFKFGCMVLLIVGVISVIVFGFLYFQEQRLPGSEIQKQIDQVVKSPTPTSAPTIAFTPTIAPTATPVPTATAIPTPIPTPTLSPVQEFALLEQQFNQWREVQVQALGTLPYALEGKYESVVNVFLPACGIVDMTTLFELETSEYIHLGNQEISLFGEHQLLGQMKQPGLVIKVPLLKLRLPTLDLSESSNTEYISELKLFLSKCYDDYDPLARIVNEPKWWHKDQINKAPTPTPTPSDTEVIVRLHPTATPVPTPPRTPMSTQTPERTDSSIDRTVRPTLDDEWIKNLERLIHELTNKERLKHNLPALEYDPAIANIARLHSEDMAKSHFYEHDNLRGESPTDRANKAGYFCRVETGWGLAENIAMDGIYSMIWIWDNGELSHYDYYSPEELAFKIVSGDNSWMTSPGHRENILDPTNVSEGIGVAVYDEVSQELIDNLGEEFGDDYGRVYDTDIYIFTTQNFSGCTPK